MTYRHTGWKHLISYLLNLAHEIHCGCFAFKCINSEVVQNLECKCHFWVLETCGEKLCTKKKLNILVWGFGTMAPSDRACEDTGQCDDDQIRSGSELRRFRGR